VWRGGAGHGMMKSREKSSHDEKFEDDDDSDLDELEVSLANLQDKLLAEIND
jgi:hypothetical protein